MNDLWMVLLIVALAGGVYGLARLCDGVRTR